MQLRRLEVRHIRSFERASLEFGPGTTLVVGDVGAGKSSLLYAVEMALFGVAEVDASYLVRHGRSNAEVVVTLADATHVYTISRSLRRVRRGGRETFVPDELTFAQDGQPASYSATELRQRVIELVGFPDNPNPKAHSDLWRWAVYVPQERMREILAARPEERMETIRKALGVERFRIAAENAAALASDLRKEAGRLREDAGRLAFWDEELSKALTERTSLERDAAEHRAEIAQRETALAACRVDVGRQEELRARLEADERERTTLEAERASLARSEEELAATESRLARQAKVDGDERARALALLAGRSELEARLAGLDAQVRETEAGLASGESVLRELAASRAREDAAVRARVDLEQRRARAVAGHSECTAALETLATEGPGREPSAPTPRTLAELDAVLSDARADEERAREAQGRARTEHATLEALVREGVCPTCHQAVRSEEFAHHQQEAEAARAAAEVAVEAASVRRTSAEEERRSRERYERAHDRWIEVERRRAERREALERWDQELAAAEAALSTWSSEPGSVASLETQRSEADARQRRLLAQRDADRARRESVARELEGVGRAEERAARLATAVERTLAELERARTERERRREDGQRRDHRLEELRRATEALPRIRADLAAAVAAAKAEEDALARARERLAGVVATSEALAARVALAERGRAERTARVEEAAGLDARAAWIGEPLRYHLLAMEKDLLAHAQASFDRAFSRFFAAMIDDPGMVARTDPSFTPEVLLNGEPTPAEALSGGERTSLALAFRLALSSTVRSLGEVRLETLLLDEPTDGFSSEQVVRMGELLEELGLPQVIVVSHEAQLAGIADRTVRVVKKDGRSALFGPDEAGVRGPPEAAAGPPDPADG